MAMFRNKNVGERIDLNVGDNRKTARRLVELGMLDKSRPAFTNRGIAHLVVECNVPFLKVRSTWPGNFAATEAELQHLAKHFDGNVDWINAYFYAKYSQYIEWDQFDQWHDFRHMDVDQLRTFAFAVFEKLVDGAAIPLPKLLKQYGIPEPMIQSGRVDKAVLMEVFRQLKS